MQKLLVVSAPEQFEKILEDSCSPLNKLHKPNPQITVYTRSFETRGYKSKIKTSIRLKNLHKSIRQKKIKTLGVVRII